MSRTQLNVNIDPQLLARLKSAAIREGKTISQFVSESLILQLEDTPPLTIDSKLDLVEKRLKTIEASIFQLASADSQIIKYSEEDVEKFNQFVKLVFTKETKRKQYRSSKDAWEELIVYINCFEQWNNNYTLKLKDFLLSSNREA